MNLTQGIPKKIRLSVGSAIVLELLKGKLDVAPTTVYILTYREDKCLANCGFCPQARTSKSRADMLARVTWPAFSTSQIIEKLSLSAEKGNVKRVCIQALNYPNVFNDVLHLTKLLHYSSNVPISLSCQPLNKTQMKVLAKSGVDRISVALDAATAELFDTVKGLSIHSPYTWRRQRKALKEAVEVFGNNQVYTHLIVGLGETEKEIAETIQWCTDSGVYPSLFAFTPIPGTALENMPPPSIETYRRVQLAQYLIIQGKTRSQNMKFDDKGRIVQFGVSETEIQEAILQGSPFRTSGCPECNRPYYNERPGGPMYNFPRAPLSNEIEAIKDQLREG